jgi:cellulase/cellobiase CelA1
VNGGSSTPPPPPPPPPSSGCSAAYSVVSSWPGGYQAQVVVTNTGSGTLNGWQLGWKFPGNEDITNLWNGTYTQSGTQVTVNNASYDGALAPGATATVGFTANGSGSPAPSISCS